MKRPMAMVRLHLLRPDGRAWCGRTTAAEQLDPAKGPAVYCRKCRLALAGWQARERRAAR